MGTSPSDGQGMEVGSEHQSAVDLIAHALAAGRGVEGLDQSYLRRIKNNPIQETSDAIFFELERHKPIVLPGYPLRLEEGFLACIISMRRYRLDKTSNAQMECVAVWNEQSDVAWDSIIVRELTILTEAGAVQDILQTVPRTQRHDKVVITSAVQAYLQDVHFDSLLMDAPELPGNGSETLEHELRAKRLEALVEEVRDYVDNWDEDE